MTETNLNISADETASTTTGEPVITQAPTDITEKVRCFPNDYLITGYRTVDGFRDPRYVMSYAEEIAATLAPMEKEYFRTYYGEVDSVRYLTWTYSGEPWVTFEDQKLLLAQLTARSAHAVYAGKAPAFFHEFMQRNYDVVTDSDTFRCFCDHMEAIYCLMK